jgi:hypothetical protein
MSPSAATSAPAFLDSPVIEDDQVGFCQLIDQWGVAAIAMGDTQRLEQTR